MTDGPPTVFPPRLPPPLFASHNELGPLRVLLRHLLGLDRRRVLAAAGRGAVAHNRPMHPTCRPLPPSRTPTDRSCTLQPQPRPHLKVSCVIETSSSTMLKLWARCVSIRRMSRLTTSRCVSSCEALYCAITDLSVSWMMLGSTRSASRGGGGVGRRAGGVGQASAVRWCSGGCPPRGQKCSAKHFTPHSLLRADPLPHPQTHQRSRCRGYGRSRAGARGWGGSAHAARC